MSKLRVLSCESCAWIAEVKICLTFTFNGFTTYIIFFWYIKLIISNTLIVAAPEILQPCWTFIPVCCFYWLPAECVTPLLPTSTWEGRNQLQGHVLICLAQDSGSKLVCGNFIKHINLEILTIWAQYKNKNNTSLNIKILTQSPSSSISWYCTLW